MMSEQTIEQTKTIPGINTAIRDIITSHIVTPTIYFIILSTNT